MNRYISNRSVCGIWAIIFAATVVCGVSLLPVTAFADPQHVRAEPSGEAPPPALAIAPFDTPAAKAHQEAWAKHLGVPVEVTNSIGMEMVLIPPGEFMMGSPASNQRSGESPRH